MRPASARSIQVQVLTWMDGTDVRGEYRYAFPVSDFPPSNRFEIIITIVSIIQVKRRHIFSLLYLDSSDTYRAS